MILSSPLHILYITQFFSIFDRLCGKLSYNPTMTEKDTKQSLEDHPVYGAPGLGLASYSCLLLIFFFIGLGGIILSTASLFQASFQDEPFSLIPGNQVKAWRLQPMRDAKVIDYTEVPLFYHDESNDGTSACALSKTHVLRVDRGQGWKVPIDVIENIEIIRDGEDIITYLKIKTVNIKNQDRANTEVLPCYFKAGEGAERLKIYIRELQKGNIPAPPSATP